MSGGLVAASIQLDAAEVKVNVRPAGVGDLDGVYFLNLDVTGGWATIGGTLEELRLLADRVYEAVNEA